MTKIIKYSLVMMFFILVGCKASSQADTQDKGTSEIEKGKITIRNPELEYEVIIFDTGFENWLTKKGRPRGYYSQSFLENHNRRWVSTWNSRARTGKPGYDYTIDYTFTTNYGYEVNYMLYHYLKYWQETNRINLD